MACDQSVCWHIGLPIDGKKKAKQHGSTFLAGTGSAAPLAWLQQLSAASACPGPAHAFLTTITLLGPAGAASPAQHPAPAGGKPALFHACSAAEGLQTPNECVSACSLHGASCMCIRPWHAWAMHGPCRPHDALKVLPHFWRRRRAAPASTLSASATRTQASAAGGAQRTFWPLVYGEWCACCAWRACRACCFYTPQPRMMCLPLAKGQCVNVALLLAPSPACALPSRLCTTAGEYVLHPPFLPI